MLGRALCSDFFIHPAPLNGDILLCPLISLTNYKTASKQIVNVRYLAPVGKETGTKREPKRKSQECYNRISRITFRERIGRTGRIINDWKMLFLYRKQCRRKCVALQKHKLSRFFSDWIDFTHFYLIEK